MPEAETNDNSVTLRTYEDHLQTYFEATPAQVSGHVKTWIDRALSNTNRTHLILELGSGTGRDADYIEDLGYQIIRSDATTGFVERMREQGHTTRQLNVLTDELGGPYGLILANAVLLHFTSAEFRKILNKIYAALTNKGIMALTVKQGNGSEWISSKMDAPRFFQYWQKNSLARVVESSGFSIINLEEAASQSRPGTIWLHLIAQKKPHSSSHSRAF